MLKQKPLVAMLNKMSPYESPTHNRSPVQAEASKGPINVFSTFDESKKVLQMTKTAFPSSKRRTDTDLHPDYQSNNRTSSRKRRQQRGLKAAAATPSEYSNKDVQSVYIKKQPKMMQSMKTKPKDDVVESEDDNMS